MHGTFPSCRKSLVAFSGFRFISFHFVSLLAVLLYHRSSLLDNMLFASLLVSLHIYIRVILLSRLNVFC